MTNLRDIIKYLQILAPQDLTIRGLESKVEVGPQTEGEQLKTTVNRVIVSTYPSARTITKATQDKANLLITHRQLFPFAIDRITGLDLIRIRLLSKNYISSYVVGSAWIGARGGLSDALVETLELKKKQDFTIQGDSGPVPIGRICEVPSVMNHSGFANYVAAKMGLESVIFSGDFDDEVKSVLISPGYYLDIPELLETKMQDVNTIVTGELSPEIRLLAREEGLNILELGTFCTEEPGMERLRHQLSLEFPKIKIEFVESGPITNVLRPYDKDMA
ncbi:MAG: Nif3-like dinuclear metal center hexameric protein [Candidatus Thorarchaeota archaeon]|jgi:putative NIF3 family GTP cyclohydrolase 1 type 2